MTATGHPRHRLDELLTHAVRFSIVAAPADVDRAEFFLVRDGVEKGRVGRRPRTWLRPTDAGPAALAPHVTALRAIAGGIGT